MASKSRARPKQKRGKSDQFAELGLFNIPNLDSLDNNSDDGSEVDESALEFELEALMSGREKAPTKPTRPKPKAKPAIDIERLAAECLDDNTDPDEDEEGLSNDEELLNELQTLTTERYPEEVEARECVPERKKSSEISSENSSHTHTVSVLQERLTMYNEAIEEAKRIGDTSKIRRYTRAVKTIETLMKSANSGASINEEDIPPVVCVKTTKNPPPTLISSKSSSEPDMNLNEFDAVTNQSNDADGRNHQELQTSIKAPNDISQLCMRRDQYKKAALMTKRDGNKELAIQFLRTVKTFDCVIEAMNNNLPVDLSNMPPPLEGFPEFATTTAKVLTQQRVTHDNIQTSSDMEKAALAAADETEQPEIFSAPPPPSTISEALEQRLEKYSATKQSAEEEGNGGKVRRLERIIKQYQKAIKDYKAGKSVNFEELPTPPGFGPIPSVEGPARTPQNPKSEQKLPAPERARPPGNSMNKTPPSEKQMSTIANNPETSKKPKVQRTNTSTNKQLDFLLERQKLFRQAAFGAKKNGDIPQAKEYLRMSKGFDSMIEATKCGLPIDATTIPTPPQLESDFVIVDVSECIENDDRSPEELYENLEKDLSNQIEVCSRNKEHFLRLGDVSSASKFEKLCLESKKDLSVIMNLKKKGEPAPRFHYETRLFSVVQCHTDLGDNDLLVAVERGINLPGKPDDLDSYVKIEFPIPPETPLRAKTHTIRDTNNPIFKEEFKFEFNRKSRSQLRQFKRQMLKLEVWSKGGFLRSDTHLGTVSIKLAELESKCSVHDSFNLMDGRKACGGKLEVKVRIRDPLLVKQVEEVREKWLVVGS